MRKLQRFDSFGALNEEQKLSNLDLYRPVALGVAEAFSIYGYYVSLLEEKVNQDDWDRLISSITSIRDYEGKWRQIIVPVRSLRCRNTLALSRVSSRRCDG